MGSGLSQMATSAYTGIDKRLFPVGNHAALKNDLDNIPVLEHVLCLLKIYHRFGLGVAPLTLMLSTVRHVDVTHQTWLLNEISISI